MKSFNENFSEIFDLTPITEEISNTDSDFSFTDTSNSTDISVISTNISSNTSPELSIESDSEFARKNIRELILKGHRAIDSILNIAEQSEHPRAFEVAANFIKNISELNKDLLEIQKRKRELIIPRETHNSSGDINVNQAVFVGSTKELLKIIKDNQIKEIENDGSTD